MPSQVKVVFAQVSLINPDVDELAASVFKIIPHESYDPVTKLNNIALIEVFQLIEIRALICKKNSIIFHRFLRLLSLALTSISYGTTSLKKSSVLRVILLAGAELQ